MLQKSFVFMVITAYLFMSSASVWAESLIMTVSNVKDSSIVGDKGSNDGVRVGDMFDITSSQNWNQSLAQAKVVVVKEKLCGLKLIAGSTTKIQSGFLMVRQNENVQDIFDQIENNESYKPSLKYQNSQNKVDHYYNGINYAQRDYSGGGALAGGLVAGFALGLIGWGIGYVIVANQGVDVPHHYVANLPSDQQFQFNEGYTKQVKKKRNSKYHTGAAIGMIVLLVVVISASGSSSN